MARRSARLQTTDPLKQVSEAQREFAYVIGASASDETPRAKKRKTEEIITIEPVKSAAKAKEAAVAPKDQANDAPPSISSGDDLLSSLPQEIQDMILDKVVEPASIGRLGRTCKRYHALMVPRLYRRIAVAAMFHAHIPKLIRNLEPHLAISQKKQLKREGKYKGQADRFSSALEPNQVPECASHVREMIAGYSDPGRKHKYIVDRYLEEAFKNMKNLEVVETRVLTKSIAESLASMKNLQALNIDLGTIGDGVAGFLKQIVNLKHLSMEGSNVETINNGDFLPTLLSNSMSTLRTLIIKTGPHGESFLNGWENKIPRKKGSTNQSHDFKSLKSLTLAHCSFDEGFTQSLKEAFDFMALHELVIESLGPGSRLFFQMLSDLATSAAKIDLQSLFVDLGHGGSWSWQQDNREEELQSKLRFISSFDSLISLELGSYGEYPSDIPTNPGIPDVMLQAILKHRNLKSLKITYNGITSNHKVPYLTASTVTTIIKNLPQLEEFHFAPEESQIYEIGKALAYGANLRAVTCSPHDSRLNYPSSGDPGFNILTRIINAFLAYSIDQNNLEKSVWEDTTKLNRVSVGYRTWDVGSRFGKSKKGMKKPEKLQVDGGKKREVMYREITGTFPTYIHVGFDPMHSWVEKAASNLA